MDSTLQAVLLDLKHCTYSWRQPEPPRWNQNHGKEWEIMTTEPLFHLSSVAIRDGRSYDRALARPVTAKPPTAAAARVEIHALVIVWKAHGEDRKPSGYTPVSRDVRSPEMDGDLYQLWS